MERRKVVEGIGIYIMMVNWSKEVAPVLAETNRLYPKIADVPEFDVQLC